MMSPACRPVSGRIRSAAPPRTNSQEPTQSGRLLGNYLLLGQLVLNLVGVEKPGSKRCFLSGEFLSVRLFAGLCCLRDSHRWLRSHVEEPHQSFQVLCHGSEVELLAHELDST